MDRCTRDVRVASPELVILFAPGGVLLYAMAILLQRHALSEIDFFRQVNQGLFVPDSNLVPEPPQQPELRCRKVFGKVDTAWKGQDARIDSFEPTNGHWVAASSGNTSEQ